MKKKQKQKSTDVKSLTMHYTPTKINKGQINSLKPLKKNKTDSVSLADKTYQLTSTLSADIVLTAKQFQLNINKLRCRDDKKTVNRIISQQ